LFIFLPRTCLYFHTTVHAHFLELANKFNPGTNLTDKGHN
jgi:hypothetical protein